MLSHIAWNLRIPTERFCDWAGRLSDFLDEESRFNKKFLNLMDTIFDHHDDTMGFRKSLKVFKYRRI
jgi:hypothetical protein